MTIEYFEKTVVGLVRKANEDSIGSLSIENTNGYGDIFVVCDGMGGHVGGAVASKTAVDCILQYFQGTPNSNPIIALEKSISFANMQIYAKAIHDESLKGMGTTCTVLLIKDDNIYIAHVGDSRIYINTDNKLFRLTKDHSFVQSLVDAGHLEESEMEKHPRKNELTRALGISQDVDVEVADEPITSKKGDRFLMCSDGLCGLVNDTIISQTINTTKKDQTVNDLIQLAENAGGSDNISVTIIEIIDSPHKKTNFKDHSNKSQDFSSTQVLDVSSMKLKRKRKRGYKKYLIGFFILTLLYAGFKVYNRFFDENKPQLSEPNKADKKIKVEKNEDDEIDLESVPKKGPYNEPDMDQIIKSKKSSHNKESTLINKEKIQKQEKTESNTNKISVLINEIKKLIEEQKKFKDNEQYKNLLKVNEFIEKKKLNHIDYDSLEEKVRPKINAFEDFISKENENSKNIRDKERSQKKDNVS